MTIEWVDVQNMAPSWARVWLYGPARSGKTVCASQFPNPFWVYPHNENSITSLRGVQNVRGAACIGKDPLEVRTDLTSLTDMLLAADEAGTLHRQFGETIVIDAFTHLNDLILNDVANSDTGKGGKNAVGMNEQKWGVYLAYLLRFRDALFRLRAHLVFISLAQTKSKSPTMGPAVQGQGGMLLPASCDVLVFCEAAPQRQFIAHCESYMGYEAGPRLGMGFQPCSFPAHQLWSTIAPFFGRR